jgi:hypothetical protein
MLEQPIDNEQLVQKVENVIAPGQRPENEETFYRSVVELVRKHGV